MPEKAKDRAIREIVIAMWNNHESVDLIHKYTAMPKEEILKIGKEQQEKGIKKDTFFKTVFQNKTIFRMCQHLPYSGIQDPNMEKTHSRPPQEKPDQGLPVTIHCTDTVL